MELKALHAAGFGVPLGEIFAHLIHMIANVIQQDVGCAHRTAPHRTAPHRTAHLRSLNHLYPFYSHIYKNRMGLL